MSGAVRPRHIPCGVHRDNCAFTLLGIIRLTRSTRGVKRPGLALDHTLPSIAKVGRYLCDFWTPPSHEILFKLEESRIQIFWNLTPW
jgi:hypothetical protein